MSQNRTAIIKDKIIGNEIRRLWIALDNTKKTAESAQKISVDVQQTVLSGSSVSQPAGAVPQEPATTPPITTPLVVPPVTPPSMYNFYPGLTGLQYGRILVDWSLYPGLTDPNISGYDIFCTTDSACLTVDANLFGSYLRGSNFVISGLGKGSTYYVRVRPRSENGIGIESEIASVTLPTDIGLYQSDAVPTVTGDIKVVTGVGGGGPIVVIHDCDTIAAWSVVSGSPTISLEVLSQHQGSGCIKVAVPASATIIVKCTVSAKDLSTKNKIKLFLKQYLNFLGSFTLYFGESTYNEQSKVIANPPNSWSDFEWDISDIAAASRNGVTLFGIGCTNTMPWPTWLYIDYIRSEGLTEKLEVALSDHVLDLTQIDVERSAVLSDHFFYLNADLWDTDGVLVAGSNGVIEIAGYLTQKGGDTSLPFSASKNPILRINQAQFLTSGTRFLGLTTTAFGGSDQTGIYWRYANAGHYIAVCRNGASETVLDTAIHAAAGTFNRLRLEITSALVSVYVDGILKGTITTNIPTAPMFFDGSGAPGAGFDLDYVQIIQDN